MNSVAFRRKTRISQTAKLWRRVWGEASSGRPPAEVDAGGDRRQHAREAQLVRGNEGRVGREQRDRDLGRRVVDPAPDLRDHEAHRQPDRDPAGRRAHELEPRVERREAPTHRSGHGHPVGDQRGRVVDEALALDDVDEPARRADLAHDRGRGDGSVGETIAPSANAIGQESPIASWAITATTPRSLASTRPIEASEIPRRSLRSARRSEKNAAAYSSGGRKITSTRSGSSSIVRDARDQTEHQPAEHERDRVRHRQPARERVQARDRDEQRRQDEFEILHVGRDPISARAVPMRRTASRQEESACRRRGCRGRA